MPVSWIAMGLWGGLMTALLLGMARRNVGRSLPERMEAARQIGIMAVAILVLTVALSGLVTLSFAAGSVLKLNADDEQGFPAFEGAATIYRGESGFPTTATLDPILAKRYGLVPPNEPKAEEVAPTREPRPFRMDPALMRRYGLSDPP
jgi:hypothetical protein